MGKSVGRSRGRSRSPSARGPYGRPSRFGSGSRSPSRGRFDGPRQSRFDSPPRFDGPPGSRFDGPPHRFDGPPGRFDGPPGRFDGPPPLPGRFDGPHHGRFDGPPKSRFDMPPQSRFDGPPPPFDHPGPGLEIPPPPPLPEGPGNDIEIIVVNREQWRYAEMIEKRLKEETPVKFIDLLFLHSPQHISMTLNDLFERRTLYAIVVTPANEEKRSCTLHVLHNQEEHRNIPIDEAIPLISRDFAVYNGQQPPSEGFSENFEMPKPPEVPNYSSVTGSTPLFPAAAAVAATSSSNGSNPTNKPTNIPPSNPSSGASQASGKRLPDDIAYLLRTTLSEGGIQFLSLPQIDSIIDYFKRERDRLTSSVPTRRVNPITTGSEFQSSTGVSGYSSTSSAATGSITGGGSSALNNVPTDPNTLLENPQVKAALNSLLQIGAITSASGSSSGATSASGISTNNISTSSYSTSNSYSTPSYLSTSSSNNNNSSSSSMPLHFSNSTSASSPYQQSLTSSGSANQPPRRHPLMGTEISGPMGPSSYSSYGMRNNNNPSNNPSNRGYATGSRY